METKNVPQYFGGEMSAKRLAGLVVAVFVLVSSAVAQDRDNSTPVNQISVTAGRTFVSTETIQNPPVGDVNPKIHFANPASVAFNYGRLLKSRSSMPNCRWPSIFGWT